jgi:hypothetical protein
MIPGWMPERNLLYLDETKPCNELKIPHESVYFVQSDESNHMQGICLVEKVTSC